MEITRWPNRLETVSWQRLFLIYHSENRCFRKIHFFREIHDQIRAFGNDVSYSVEKQFKTDRIENVAWLKTRGRRRLVSLFVRSATVVEPVT